MRIDELIVGPGREEHIGRHRVSVSEAREVVFGNPFVGRTRRGRYRLIGQTEAGRYLTVIVAFVETGICTLVTARDADDAERRLYRRRRRS